MGAMATPGLKSGRFSGYTPWQSAVRSEKSREIMNYAERRIGRRGRCWNVRTDPAPHRSGGDKKQYIYGVNDMVKYLKQELGAPTDSGRNPNENAKGGDNKGGISGMMDRIKGQKGIFVYQGALHGATGHASLWDGNKVVQQGSDYSDNPNMRAYFWKLPDATDK